MAGAVKVDLIEFPPGPRVPGALQMAATWTRPAASMERLRRKYGKRITVKLPFQPPFVILSDPAEIKELLQAPPDVIHPGEGARILAPIVGKQSAMLLEARHEDDSPMSPQEIRDELMTALLAGHETTASQLAWAFERLARDRRVAVKLTAEVDAGESDEYTTAVVNEILRLKPVLP